MTPNWFIGLPVDPGRWFAPLVRLAPDCVRVFHADDIHITVAFLGSCGEPRARLAWEHVVEHQQQLLTEVIPATLGGIEPMGNPRRPSALSVLLDQGSRPVAELIGTLRDGAWSAAEARPDRRPPLPHITVARPRRRANGAERRAALRWAREQPKVDASITLDRLALMTWAKDRQLRQFHAIEQCALTHPTPGAAPTERASERGG